MFKPMRYTDISATKKANQTFFIFKTKSRSDSASLGCNKDR